jgi:hypothetical protein
MALIPIDEVHSLQIQAGTLGRRAGHDFEDQICRYINELTYPFTPQFTNSRHVLNGNPATILLTYISNYFQKRQIITAAALSTGALATLESGQNWLLVNGANVRRCKSDILISLEFSDHTKTTIGVSTKQCNNPTPTNAQLFFTTARGFVTLLRDHNIYVSDNALVELRKFCGDPGFQPLDDPETVAYRLVDHRRFFWEELSVASRNEWEHVFSAEQDQITRLLLQKAYIEDQFVPDFLIHKTHRSESWDTTEVAVYSIEELVLLSRKYKGFNTKPYSVRKGSFIDPPSVFHLAPRFGIVQMQRGGQAQHPNQLQFNLEAGYFYRGPLS